MISFQRDFERQRRREMRRTWWHGFLGGLLVCLAVVWLAQPIVTGQWHLL